MGNLCSFFLFFYLTRSVLLSFLSYMNSKIDIKIQLRLGLYNPLGSCEIDGLLVPPGKAFKLLTGHLITD